MEERIISRGCQMQKLKKIIGSIYPTGKPKLLHLLRCVVVEVGNHIYTRHALHLQQFRFVSKAG